MGEMLFDDMGVLARRGVWPREKTLRYLSLAAVTAERLPPTPLSAQVIAIDCH